MLTAKGAATRQRIIEAASDQIREYGVAATRLDDVGLRSRTGKSQMFHYFPGGKEELLVAVAAYEAQRVLDDQQPHLGTLNSWPTWHAWRDAVIDRYRKQGERCPLGVLLTEVGRQTPAAREITRRLLADWQDSLRQGIATMQAAGAVESGIDPDRAAAACVAGIQGGVVILMATGDIGHLEAALDLFLTHLRGTAVTAAEGQPAAVR
ncbi:TetR/AcrR family transcriptional regulator [Actinacidiphila glaucinigra]|uniref:TetR/AcrR family transcriptional regulator n=1 Tax=Actinacidiphila glaucinigra TaxID=235986 RepID=UPI0029A6EABD|nr:TetR/AcrR family transcriptional regulator [Streptomyces sp. PA03-3a]